MSLSDPSLTKQQRIQVWREEVAASASLCTCPPSSSAASASSTNISFSAASSSSSPSSPGVGDAFTFPRGDILPSQPTSCPRCSRLGAPSAMGLDPSASYLDNTQVLPNGHVVPGGGFRTKNGNHTIFRGMRNLVRKLSGSRTSVGGPLPPRGAEDATKMYRRATLAGFPGVTTNAAADADVDADLDCAPDDADSEGRGQVPRLIAEKQARLRRASRLLMRTHGSH